MTENRLKLLERFQVEQDLFKVSRLESKFPDVVLENAYEYIIRQDIMMAFYEENILTDETVVELLLKRDYPLSDCYKALEKRHFNYMETLLCMMNDFETELKNKNQEE